MMEKIKMTDVLQGFHPLYNFHDTPYDWLGVNDPEQYITHRPCKVCIYILW